MKTRFRIGTAAKIPLFLHWTFLLIPAYVLVTGALMGRPVFGVLADLALVTLIFSCVVLHELGHALAARRFGVQTRDIILMPIGGVARLECMPKKPAEELVVALAGPAVNVVIASVLLSMTVPFIGLDGLVNPTSLSANFVGKAIAVNLAMVVFNLLPAFPMDGGRVLRALISLRTGHLTATRVAAKVGQIMAVLIGSGGLFIFNNPMLIFIAGFVYLGAVQEANSAEMEASFEGVNVGDVMITQFDAIPSHAPAEWTLRRTLATNSREVPVVSNGTFRGMLKMEHVAKAVSGGRPDVSVGQLCTMPKASIRAGEPLLLAIEWLQSSEYLSLPVLNDFGDLEGLITRDSILAAQQFFSLLKSHSASAVTEKPDELRQHLVRMQIG